MSGYPGGGYPGGAAPPPGGGYPAGAGYPGGAAPPPGGAYPGGAPGGGAYGQQRPGAPSGYGAYPGAPPPQVDQTTAQWFHAVDQDKSGQITAPELQKALVNGNWSHFSEEACRMMIGKKNNPF